MSLNENNRKIADDTCAALEMFEWHTGDLTALQTALQSAAERCENDGSDLRRLIQLAEADLEEIQFTVLSSEQFPAAVRVARWLLATINALG